MSKIYTTEIASDQLVSDNPLHQRLLKPYLAAALWVKGDLLEVGCGEGRGITHLLPHISSYTAIDKIATAIEALQSKYPSANLTAASLPPLPYADASFDSVVSFQVIEHIRDDSLFLNEIHRVLRPGGVALLTTPNRHLSLSRNPWHVREYTGEELSALASLIFPFVEMKGITGNEKVMAYHDQNRKSVNRIMRWDVLNLQYRLPAFLLRVPYDLLNRLNRNRLREKSDKLVSEISATDYQVVDRADEALDLFLIVRKS
jgi:SAM-dependent methyltransferase